VTRLLKKYYRDLTALGYLFFLYPLFSRVADFSPESKEWGLVVGLWLLIAVAGAVANVVKIRALGPEIEEHKLQKVVQSQGMRFMAGLIALPLMIVLPVFIWWESSHETTTPDWALGVPYLIIGGILWLLLDPTAGVGRKAARSRNPARLATAALVVFELFVYTVFLEGLGSGDAGFHVSLTSIVILVFPTSALFFLLFLPSTIGFYVEATVRYRSAGVAAGVLWLRFILTRYLPVYVLFYLEGQGWRLPWFL